MLYLTYWCFFLIIFFTWFKKQDLMYLGQLSDYCWFKKVNTCLSCFIDRLNSYITNTVNGTVYILCSRWLPFQYVSHWMCSFAWLVLGCSLYLLPVAYQETKLFECLSSGCVLQHLHELNWCIVFSFLINYIDFYQ